VLIKHERRRAPNLIAADEYCWAQRLYCTEQVIAVCRTAVAVRELVVFQRAAVTPADSTAQQSATVQWQHTSMVTFMAKEHC
jgi:hypothetical protein